MFHVEHYRPKSRFAELANEYRNLFYACPICNCFKGDDWPCEPVGDHSLAAYPDPGGVDYNCLFCVDEVTGRVEGVNVAGRYLAEKLYLNRPQLVVERRLAQIRSRLADVAASLDSVSRSLQSLDSNEARRLLAMLVPALIEIMKMQNGVFGLRPYGPCDTSRH